MVQFKNKWETEIENLMNEGVKSKLRGWSMKNIIKSIEEKHGEQAGLEAKEYILKKYGI
jgi:hypothetical protein